MTLLRVRRALQQASTKRFYSENSIRNIGILAHIDAGKTTTTERMLFYSGKTRSMGEVHRGNTVTDYLTQERERGITICSSAVTFPWNGHKINLLDTPGHIDFTMEVEQALNAVDGVIVVLDGTAGVEAQTSTVWAQAEKHRLPKIAFVNKMDRADADFDKCVEDMKNKLDAKSVCLQLPEKNTKGNLSILDIISLERFTWNSASLGREYTAHKIEDGDVLFKLREKRNELIDQISDVDDILAEVVINSENFDSVGSKWIRSAIRRTTIEGKAVPVLLGSAYRNVGVQRLMDAVINYLPTPPERNQLYDCFENDFVGKIFKITHDKQRGVLALVRIFRGELKRGMRLVTTHGSTEVVSKIYQPLADEYLEINTAAAGDIAICSGFKKTVTGDLLISNATSLKSAQKRLRTLLEKVDKSHEEGVRDVIGEAGINFINETFLTEPQIPDAVYFCSIEPPSLSAQNGMELALKELQREDPSLRVSYDTVTGQTILGGMGELHMDIIKSRILSEYKIEVDLGPLQIAYKETIEESAIDSLSVEKDISGNKQSVTITIELLKNNNEEFSLDKSPENMANLKALRPRTLQTIRKGAVSALERGPRVGGQVVGVQVRLHHVSIGRGTADSFVRAAAAQCVQMILKNLGTKLLEPIMALHIIVPAEYVPSVMSDLARRRATINGVQQKGVKNKLIAITAPLAELSGYSSILRSISSGTAIMSMQPCGFTNMNTNEELRAVQRIQGL